MSKALMKRIDPKIFYLFPVLQNSRIWQISHLGLRALHMALPWWTKQWHSLSCSSGGIIFFKSDSIFAGSVFVVRPMR